MFDDTDFTTIATEVDERVLTVTLNRPEQLNSFPPAMADELERLFLAVSHDDRVGAVIVTGAGRAFCAGMDLTTEGNVFGLNEELRPTYQDLVDRYGDPEIVNGVRDTGGRVALAIYACTKPVIAAINGPAVGVGATMTLPMDFRLASDRARLGFVFSRIGIVPETCATWFLPRVVGLEKALELVYTGDILTAEEAHAIGLVRSVHPGEELLAEAHAFARRLIAGKSSVGVALTRRLMYAAHGHADPVEAHRLESLAMFYASIEDGKEGVAAFLEKREAQFTADVQTGIPADVRAALGIHDPA